MPCRLLTLLLIFLGLMSTLPLLAQIPMMSFTGQVFEADARQPLEFATVRLLGETGETVLAGTNTDAAGRFTLLTDRAVTSVEVSFMGFETKRFTEFEVAGGQVDLGTILLAASSYNLENVDITGQRSSTEFLLDRRVFHVGQDLSSTGASALEVLDNVPSVNVNIEGQVSIRGSAGVQVLINGKPSVLASEDGSALGTLTADMIDRVEVITNPSAKYDAEGTSGIINIVLKKDEREGLNGSATLNTGWPHNHSFGLSLNRRTDNFNLFSQVGVGYRELPRERRNRNENLISGSLIESEGTEYRNEQFYNFILGTDYYLNEWNVITLSGNFAYEVEDQPSRNDFVLRDSLGEAQARWFREETTEATNPKWQYELQYKRDFPEHEDRALLFSAIGSFFGKDQSSDFQNTTLEGQGFDLLQQTRTNFSEAENTFKLDYTHPFGEHLTLETGAQYVMNDVSNDFEVANFQDGEWVTDLTQTNIFDWNQKVLGLYGTGAYEGDRWGVKVGLRAENTDLNTLLRTTDEANAQNYTNLFPSAHTSFEFTEQFSMQAGYSRRIFRPRLWDLNPFFNIRNNFNIRTGNPDLQPEFTDSYELAAVIAHRNLSVSSALYHRYTTEVVERVSTFNEGVTTVVPVNLGTNQAYGWELNGKYSIGRWLSLSGDFNLNWFQRRGSLDGVSFDFNAHQASGRLRSKFSLSGDWDVELTGRYQSQVRTVQGLRSRNIFMDLGLRKKILRGRGVFNLSIRDVFASRIRETVVDQDDFFVYSWGRRGRFITLGFSYGFGKGEAMEFSGRKRF